MKWILISLLIATPALASPPADLDVFFFGKTIKVKYGYCLIARYEQPHYLQYETLLIAESKAQQEVVFAVCNDKKLL